MSSRRAGIAQEAHIFDNQRCSALPQVSELVGSRALKRLSLRSDKKGILQLWCHLSIISVFGGLYAWVTASVAGARPWAAWFLAVLAAVAFGFSLVALFACMHECLHRTAFRSRWLNDWVAWFAGLVGFQNSAYFRYSHGWHHRYTQIPGMDPELDEPKPESLFGYWVELSGVRWWCVRIRTDIALILTGSVGSRFIPARCEGKVARSTRIQYSIYVLAAAVDYALVAKGLSGGSLLLKFWVIPLLSGKPLLQAILLADHTGCCFGSNYMNNTRTTYTIGIFRFLMWNMSFHSEHHRFPGVPFHSLSDLHVFLKPHIRHVSEDGYLGAQREILSRL